MAAETFRIEIPIEVSDNTDPGLSSAKQKMNAFDQTNEKTKNRLDQMNRTKWKVAVEAVDKVTSVSSTIGTTVRGIAGKVWNVTVSIIDKVTAPVRTMISKLGELLSIGTAVSAVLGGITVADMLSAAGAQNTVEKQLQTVLANVSDSADAFDRLRGKASALQQTTMYGDETYLAGAAELATYLSDTDALEAAMDVLADYAAGMSGGAELSIEQMTELIPGVKSIASYGHTPGHTCYMVENGGQHFFIWGDLINFPTVQVPHPEIATRHDIGPVQAAATRSHILSWLEKQGITVAGMHVPYPAMGNLTMTQRGLELQLLE